MKFRPNRNYTTIAVYAFLVLAAAILFYMAICNISGFLNAFRTVFNFIQPVVYGVFLAFILNPMLRAYDDKLLSKLVGNRLRPVPRRAAAIILTWITVIIIVVILFGLFLPQLLSSFRGLIENLPEYTGTLSRMIQELMVKLEDMRLLESDSGINELVNTAVNQLITVFQGIADNMDTHLSKAFTQLISAGARFATGIVNWILGIIISIYILFDREKLFAQIRKIGAALLPDHLAGLFYDVAIEINRVFSGFIIGKIIDSLIIGVLCTMGMRIFSIPYPMPISVLVGVTNLIPYFGPFIGGIIGTLLILFVNPWKALLFVIFIIALQQFDGNVLGPKILGNTTGLSALWVVFSILLFGGLFGAVGMLLGVPMFAVICAIIKRAIAYLLIRKGRSTNTRDYASENNPLIK